MLFYLQRRHRIRKNAEYISEELAEFLAYIENSADEFAQGSKTPGVKLLHEKVKQIKRDAKLEAWITITAGATSIEEFVNKSEI